ncbi:DUF3592 domain-containing protein [Deinococcus deserti]|uniref:DUF3592 domain-containing protein n=1 Tax=Deinococcus deserti TaxID=310783 RepID=UPI0013922B0C|nr:DUF3592 domain-containing protein [Deinococcus deserti]
MREKAGLVVFCLIFAVMFGGGGALATAQLVGMISNWTAARSWVAVPAQVLEAELKTEPGRKGKTYEATTRYAYTFGGQTYESSRLGIGPGGDSIGDWQRSQHLALLAALNQGRQVTVWVNPSAPSQAVFNRELRIGQVLFWLPFASLFSLIGLGALWGVWWAIRSRPAGAIPPNPPRISSDERQGLWATFWFVLCWNLLVFPIGAMVLVEHGLWGSHLVVLIFPLIGLALVRWLILKAQNRRRIGRTSLVLAPAQPVCGVPLFAQVEFGKIPQEGEYTLHLLNERIVQGRKHRRTHLLWEQEVRVWAGNGTLTCRFDPPASAQSSAVNGRVLTSWRLNLRWPDGKTSRNFPLTVMPASSQMSEAAAAAHHLPEVKEVDRSEAVAMPASVGVLVPLSDGLRIEYAVGRHRASARAMLTIGVLFCAVAGLLAVRSGSSVMSLLLGLTSLGLLVTGIRSWTTPLRVEATSQFLTVRGITAYKRLNEQWPASSVKQIVPVVEGSSGADHDQRYSYALQAELSSGGKVILGNGISSRAVAEMLAQRIRDALEK